MGVSFQSAWSQVAARAAALNGRMLDAVMPRHCPLCAQPVWQADGLCAACWGELRHIDTPVCDRLGLPFAYDPGEGIYSAAALARPPVFARARAAVAFDDVSRRLVHALKYHDRHEVARLMARLMARAGRELVAEADVIAPVPLHRMRLWQRRYNQSALLAREIARGTGLTFRPGLLRRVKATRAQVGLDHRKRRQNVRSAFAVPDEMVPAVAGARVLVVDDVLTTGATADSCATACLKAGAAAVDIVAFALVLDPVRLHI
ncbi:ComF family protein [Kaustia mangrovi]|nr:ComF family protein [Kaustia mangrovi]